MLRIILSIIVGVICTTAIIMITIKILEDRYGPEDWDDDDDDDYDDDNYDDDDNDDDDDDDSRIVSIDTDGITVTPKIIHSPDYATGDISYADMMLRLTAPHLYSDKWYDEVRRNFSRWAVEQYREIATIRSEADAA